MKKRNKGFLKTAAAFTLCCAMCVQTACAAQMGFSIKLETSFKGRRRMLPLEMQAKKADSKLKSVISQVQIIMHFTVSTMAESVLSHRGQASI